MAVVAVVAVVAVKAVINKARFIVVEHCAAPTLTQRRNTAHSHCDKRDFLQDKAD
jgi:hypothetical protein